MKIDLICDVTDILADLKNTDDYLGAQKVVLRTIKKHLQKGIPVPVIERHLVVLFGYFQDLTASTRHRVDAVKYMYVMTFLETLLHKS